MPDSSRLGNNFVGLRACIDRFIWWACAAKERKRARRGSKPRKNFSRMGEASRGVSGGLSLFLGSSSPSVATQVKNCAEAVAMGEVGDKLGVIFEPADEVVVERLLELVEKEATN
ncbi:hypothetical protein V6N13_026063 [Hibiscus sabdariffa]|uniref:Uncharacterized protein n=1 Tax=Hibiscus sabdariffa TaxID=183260 RepID=A0ABR2BDI3_9ROSI